MSRPHAAAAAPPPLRGNTPDKSTPSTSEYTDLVEPFGIDEAGWISPTFSTSSASDAERSPMPCAGRMQARIVD
ncbi:MAG: hypothetical protein ACLRSD_16270 [Oscillibacter sp.]